MKALCYLLSVVLAFILGAAADNANCPYVKMLFGQNTCCPKSKCCPKNKCCPKCNCEACNCCPACSGKCCPKNKCCPNNDCCPKNIDIPGCCFFLGSGYFDENRLNCCTYSNASETTVEGLIVVVTEILLPTRTFEYTYEVVLGKVSSSEGKPGILHIKALNIPSTAKIFSKDKEIERWCLTVGTKVKVTLKDNVVVKVVVE